MASRSVDVPRAVAGPALDGLGRVLLGVQAGTSFRVLRVGTDGSIEPVHTEASSTMPGVVDAWNVVGAGDGFAVGRTQRDCREATKYVPCGVRSASATVFGPDGAERRVLAECASGCEAPEIGLCLGLRSDRTRVLAVLWCERDGQAHGTVYDPGTGAAAPVALDPDAVEWRIGGEAIAGYRYATDDWSVDDRRDGGSRSVVAASDLALAPDGTAVFSSGEQVFTQPLGGAATALAGVHGRVSAAADGRVLVRPHRHGSVLRVVGTDGASLDELRVPFVRGLAFDGATVAVLTQPCVRQRLLVWNVGQAHPRQLPPGCAPLVPRALVLLRKATNLVRLTMRVRCPASAVQGCGNTTFRVGANRYAGGAALAPGRSGDDRLGLVSASECERLRRAGSLRVRVGARRRRVPVRGTC